MFARYHYYSGNRSARVTLTELFGDRPALPSILFPSRLNHFSSQLFNDKYTSDYFIQKHTVLPYFLPFISKDKANRLIEGVKESGGHSMFLLSGMATSNLYSNSIYYCPLCIEEDIKTIGEPYFHRSHQLDGVITCKKHGCYLKIYGPYSENTLKTRYIKLSKDMIDCLIPEWPKKTVGNWLTEIASISEIIITAGFERLTFEKIGSGIRDLLYLKGYSTKKTIKQSAFCSDLKNFYGVTLLKLLHSDFNNQCNYDWPRELSRVSKKTIHPIRYILTLRFLCGSFESTKSFLLDRAKNTVEPSKLKPKQKTYMDDANWQEHLNMLIAEGKNCTEISRILETDRRTVKKYFDIIKSSSYLGAQYEKLTEREKQYLNEIKDYIQSHPQTHHKDIREKLSTQYTYLYWRNKEALYSLFLNLEPSKIGGGNKIDWELRDEECLNDLGNLYADLKQREPPVRLSKTMLMKSLKCNSIWFHIDSLPKTKQFLLAISEDVSSFQLRRIEYYCKKLLNEKGYIHTWELRKEASITQDVYEKFQVQIQTMVFSLTENMHECAYGNMHPTIEDA